MATRSPHKRGKRRPQKTTFTRNLKLQNLTAAMREAASCLGLAGSDLLDMVIDHCQTFASEFSEIANRFTDPDQASDFFSQSKERFQDLTRLNQAILTDLSLADDFDVRRSTDRGDRTFKWKYENHLSVWASIDGEDRNVWVQEHKRPGCYKHLLVADLSMINWISQFDEEERTDALPYIQMLSVLVTSVGKLYEDMRPNDALRQQQSDEAYARLTQHHDLNHDDPWYLILKQVLDDIRGVNPPPYVRDIANAIRRVDTKRKYSLSDYHVSQKRTGTLLDNISLPGLYASCIEVDQYVDDPITKRFDEYVGYDSQYNTVPVAGIDQPGSRTIGIEQNKISQRFIIMGDNPRQDRLNYVHRILQEILNHMRCDCTTRQENGVDFAKRVTAPKFRYRNGNAVYSLDISKATDTLNLEVQGLALSLVFESEITDYWMMIVQKERLFCHANGSRAWYTQTCGQPQGYKSSFPAFALVHHLVMRMVMKKNGLEDRDPSQFYRVLGDDSIISTFGPDEDELIAEDYISACSFINWSTSKEKGFLARTGSPIAFAEFAKKRVLNGQVITPIPIKLLLHAGDSTRNDLALAMWISRTYRAFGVKFAIESSSCNEVWSEEEKNILSLICSTGCIPGLSDFAPDYNQEITDWQRFCALLSYFLPKLRQTLIDQLLPDHIRDVGIGQAYDEPKEYFLGTKWEKRCFNLIEPGRENKYLTIIQMNSDIIDAIRMILHETPDSPVPEAVVALQLSADEMSKLFDAIDIVMLWESGQTPDDIISASKLLEDTVQILQRYNPRSDARSDSVQSSFVLKLVESFVALGGLKELGEVEVAG